MTDIDKLIDAVERGGTDAWHGCGEILGVERGIDFHVAYSGSLDAAKALHDALLPGWRVGNLAQASACPTDSPDYWTCWVVSPSFLDDCEQETAMASSPARAWLLCILKAYRSQVQG